MIIKFYGFIKKLKNYKNFIFLKIKWTKNKIKKKTHTIKTNYLYSSTSYQKYLLTYVKLLQKALAVFFL